MKGWYGLWRKLADKWLALGWTQRLALGEAAFFLAVAQAAIHWLPFHWISPRLGRLENAPSGAQPAPETTSALLEPDRLRQVQRVAWAVQALARYLPWDARCLAQAVAGKWMLQRRGLPSALYLGVDHGQEQWLEAHAWLCCRGEFVTGEPQHERFKVIAAFVEGPS